MISWPWLRWTGEKTEPVNLEGGRDMLVLAEKEAARKNLHLVLEVARSSRPGGWSPHGVAAGYNHGPGGLNLLENAVRIRRLPGGFICVWA